MTDSFLLVDEVICIRYYFGLITRGSSLYMPENIGSLSDYFAKMYEEVRKVEFASTDNNDRYSEFLRIKQLFLDLCAQGQDLESSVREINSKIVQLEKDMEF